MSNKVFFLITGLLIAGFVGLVAVNGGGSKEAAPEVTEVLQINETDFTSGASGENIQATLIEYGDFECPGCGALHPVLQQVKAEYGDRVQFVYRHFPLTQLHPNAMIAHRSAQAAGQQDQFYPMHDMLFERQNEWNANSGTDGNTAQEIIRGYAQELGLDLDKFDADYSDSATLSFINDQIDGGQSAGVTGTPTLFLNGERLNTPRSIDDLRATLDAAINR